MFSIIYGSSPAHRFGCFLGAQRFTAAITGPLQTGLSRRGRCPIPALFWLEWEQSLQECWAATSDFSLTPRHRARSRSPTRSPPKVIPSEAGQAKRSPAQSKSLPRAQPGGPLHPQPRSNCLRRHPPTQVQDLHDRLICSQLDGRKWPELSIR
jgi:hypothetical protein